MKSLAVFSFLFLSVTQSFATTLPFRNAEYIAKCFTFKFSGVNATITNYNDNCTRHVIIPGEFLHTDQQAYYATEIGEEAFRGKKIRSVIISNRIEKIGNGAFWDNELTSLVIPDSIS